MPKIPAPDSYPLYFIKGDDPSSYSVDERPGKPEQEDPSDQRCGTCGRWFASDGWYGHRKGFCLGPFCYRFNENRGLVEERFCIFCHNQLRWDLDVEEQDFFHKSACPCRSDVDLEPSEVHLLNMI